MKKLITTLLVTLTSFNLYAGYTVSAREATTVESVSCMSDAMIRSMNFKIQNTALNVSLDDDVTFSCNNLTRQDIKELETIRQDQSKFIRSVTKKFSQGRTISSLEVSRLGAIVNARKISSDNMCPAVETNYQSQLTQSLSDTFPKELKKCPSYYNEIRAKYVEIISSSDVKHLSIKDTCNRIVQRLNRVKTHYAANCGNGQARPRHKLGTFFKASKVRSRI